MRGSSRYASVGATIALCFGAGPLLASSYTLVQLAQGPSTNVPGQTISYSPDPGGFEKGMTQFGTSHAFASSDPGLGDAGAASSWRVDFHLSSAATLTLGYFYDFTLSVGRGLTGGSATATYKFDITSSSPSQPYLDPGNESFNFLVYGSTVDSGNPDQYNDACSDWLPHVRQEGGCSGTHQGRGEIQVPFNAGANFLGSDLYMNSYHGGTANGFDTAGVSYVIVPDGVTFTYDDLSGNPMNARGPATATPEPATWAMAVAGIAALACRRKPATRSN